MSLDKLKKTVTDALEDLSTLEVASFTGPQIELKDKKGQQVFDAIRNSLTTSTLVGYSRFETDGDAMNYVNSDLGEDKKHLLEGHNTMVEGAQKSRKDFFDFVLKVLNAKVD